jgi:hypothetical protein
MRHWPLILFCAASLCGGCCSRPGLEQTREWVRHEIPPGSSEEDVRRFSQVHGFEYRRTREAEGWAIHPGCGWIREDMLVLVRYGDDGEVSSTNVNIQNMLP